MRQHIQVLVHSDLTDIGRCYHVGASNFRSDHSSSFPSSILPFPLIAPLDLELWQDLDHPAKPHRTYINRKGPIVSGFQPLDFYRCLYNYALRAIIVFLS
jgi:hypothetical protein